MNDGKIYNLLGLAMRAGALTAGNDACMSSVRSGKAALAVVAGDTGGNAKKKYADKCKHYGVPLVELGTKESLGHAVGKAQNAILVLTDRGFAHRILQLTGENIGGEAH
ncbi:ribosomal protein L7Ae-like RNA K-turn-binding protein [Tumebacillus sp. BK434]|uniref:L7Ae/L30e/S12e/Gadd45 family ribosomal protein n=1 Tax=Tumebacillus sp. BK434 TaxID=2512169 RepID=UPI0010448DFB|nr:ribosomal L7Ae/L30e/S12e/Gadd45 family protein [Tumebacillus sp. BK434]TCP58870.1 ribosomal protein L7Ae-like RNA K-turn-binding protein [Tumebacillus sp. BK434]